MSSILSKKNLDAILNLLKDSSSKIILSPIKDIVLFLGETGAGKSTLVHLIGKNNETLKSIELNRCEYLLIDEDKKISENTTQSHTIIPDLVEDITTNAIFYDCPGFNDTRDTATDITNGFLIHKIIKHGNRFKIILVINYHSVQTGLDRRSFTELLRNVSNIIKNVTKYKDSIAAVITKVDNKVYNDGSNLILLPDREILNGVVDFLKKVKEEIPEDRPYYKNAMSLIEIFLMKNGENYERLAIFRRPDQKGSVNELPMLQNEKNHIQMLIRDNIVFTPKSLNDFGYTNSADTKNSIYRLVDGINEHIINIIQEICENMLSIYQTLEKETSDLKLVYDEFVGIQKKYLELTINMRENFTREHLTISDFIPALITTLHDLEVPQNNLTTLLNYAEQLEILQQVSENHLSIRPLEWIHGFNDLIAYINDSKEWYGLLSDIFTLLTKYEIQKNKNILQMNEIESLTTGNDFVIFLKKIFEEEIAKGRIIQRCFDTINNQLNDTKLKKLRDILIYTLKNDIIISAPEDDTKCQIRARFVKISDIPTTLLSNIKYLEIFAVNCVFIDCDLNCEGKKLKVVIAAPEWHIINTRIIDLNGANGQQHSEKRANDGKHTGDMGENGKPGLPGGAAGTMFGFGEIFKNLDKLQIKANGGRGGDGQNGGNGAGGINGRNPVLPTGFTQSTLPTDQLQSQGLRFESKTRDDDDIVVGIGKKLFSGDEYTYFDIYGSDGNPGSNGGDGGHWGKGGANGKIDIIDVKNEQKYLNYKSYEGAQGKEGIGGNGGLGGRNGNKILVSHIYKKLPNVLVVPMVVSLFTNYILPSVWTEEKTYNQGKQNDGLKGTNNTNRNGYEKRENSVQIENIPNIIKNYKIFLNNSLSDSLEKQNLLKFIENLDKIIYIANL